MFTGIVERTGVVVSAEKGPRGVCLRLRVFELAAGLREGDSVCVSGVCLTATTISADEATFDVVGETQRLSTMGRLRPGDEVNLERSLAMGARLDGHFVQGHVDAVGRISGIRDRPEDRRITVSVRNDVRPLIVPKGSVAVEGVSLTVASAGDGGFEVALIPTTLERTTIGRRRVGDAVNVETDILVRSVHHLLRLTREPNELSLDHLEHHGYA